MENLQQHIDNLLNSKIGKIKEGHLQSFAKSKKIYQFDSENKVTRIFGSLAEFKKEIKNTSVGDYMSYKGYWYSPNLDFIIPPKKQQTYNRTPVVLLKDGEITHEFNSVKEAQEFLGVHESTIQDALSGKHKTCKGYVVKRK